MSRHIQLTVAALLLCAAVRSAAQPDASRPPFDPPRTLRDPVGVVALAPLRLSGDGAATAQWLSTGVSQGIKDRLALLKRLDVEKVTKAAEPVQQLRFTAESPPPKLEATAVMHLLGTDWLLCGFCDVADDRINVALWLVGRDGAAATEGPITASGTLEQLYEVQSGLALRVAELVGASVTPEERERVSGLYAPPLDAYRWYATGIGLEPAARGPRADPAARAKALAAYEECLRLEPGFLPGRIRFAYAWVRTDRAEEGAAHALTALSGAPSGKLPVEFVLSAPLLFGRRWAADEAAMAAARQLYEDVRRQDGWEAVGEFGLGRLARCSGEWEEAAARFQAASEAAGGWPTADLWAALSARRAGLMEAAATSYRRALERAPGWSRGWCDLGNVLLRQEKPEEALAAFEAAEQADPTAACGLLGRGDAHRELGNLADAAAAYRQASRLGPEVREKADARLADLYTRDLSLDPRLAVEVQCHGEELDVQRAAERLIEALELPVSVSPWRADATVTLPAEATLAAQVMTAMAAAVQGEWVAEAGGYLLRPRPGAPLRLSAKMTPEIEREIAPLMAKLREDPDSPRLTRMLVLELVGRRLYADALPLVRKLREKAPDRMPRSLAARVFRATGNRAEAIECYEEAIESYEGAIKQGDMHAWYLLANLRARAGQFDAAVEAYRAYLAARPQDGAVRVLFASLLVRLARFDEARQELQTAQQGGRLRQEVMVATTNLLRLVDVQAGDERAFERHLRQGKARHQRGDHVRAVEHLTAARNLRPDSEEAAEALAKAIAALEADK